MQPCQRLATRPLSAMSGLSIKKMRSQLQFRVSTMLICIGLLLLPWSSTLFALPKLPPQSSGLQQFVDVVVLDVAPQLFFVAFLIAAVFLMRTILRRQWVGAGQSICEMSACLLAVMAVPAY